MVVKAVMTLIIMWLKDLTTVNGSKCVLYTIAKIESYQLKFFTILKANMEYYLNIHSDPFNPGVCQYMNSSASSDSISMLVY